MENKTPPRHGKLVAAEFRFALNGLTLRTRFAIMLRIRGKVMTNEENVPVDVPEPEPNEENSPAPEEERTDDAAELVGNDAEPSGENHAGASAYVGQVLESVSAEANVERFAKVTHLPRKVVAYILAVLYFAVGSLCIALTEYMEIALPYVVGSLMTVAGLLQFIFAIKDKEFLRTDTNKTVGSLLILALGVMILAANEWAASFVPVVWGLIGLAEAGQAFNLAVSRIARGMRSAYHVVKGIIEAVLAFLLLYDPAHHLTLHIIVFGVEFIMDGIGVLPPVRRLMNKE